MPMIDSDTLQQRLEKVLLETLNLMNDCPDGVSQDRTTYYGMAQGLLSAMFLGGIIEPMEYELRRAGIEAEFVWGNADDPE